MSNIIRKKFLSRGYSGLMVINSNSWMNSVLQALLCDTSVIQKIAQEIKIADTKYYENDYYDVLQSFFKLVDNMWDEENCIIKPRSFYDLITFYMTKEYEQTKITPIMFYTFFVKCLKASSSRKQVSVAPSEYSSKIHQESFSNWVKTFNFQKSLIADTYIGQYVFKNTCRSCSEFHYKCETFDSLTLDVFKPQTTTIQRLIDDHFQVDFHHLTCEICDDTSRSSDPDPYYNTREHEVTKFIYKGPETLVLNLNRKNAGVKAQVRIPENLDFTEHIRTNTEESVKYQLQSIVFQEGENFYTLIKRNDTFTVFDNADVYSVEDDILSSIDLTEPVIVVYKKLISK